MNLVHRWWLILFWVLPAWFLLQFSLDLHCTQKASFLTAVFGEQHPEDGLGEGQSFPLIYQGVLGVLLRLYASVCILAACFGPAVTAHLRWRRTRVFAGALVAMGLAALLPGVNAALLGQPVLGERFEALGVFTSAVGLGLAIMAAVVLTLERWLGPER